ncbi:MAG: HD domain-containing protein [Deltaproteobacteria bacterium]|nr:HD domain-containing protein [Deltaproteobacteria bacterium]
MLARIPPDIHAISEGLGKAGWRSWIVGGCTRDLLLGRPVHDWDVATDARPEDVVKLFRRVIPTGIKHGTVTVMRGSTGYEVTTLRGEGAYSDGRHPDAVTFVDDLKEDLARRDFTVNAIALDPKSGELSDPFDGEGDLRARVLRAVGEPERRFSEDGLRLMRAARFCATLGFEIEPGTLAAMASSVQTLAKVSDERVRDELLKTFLAPKPSRGLEAMRRTGILEVVLPELVAMVGCEQNKWHAYDVWTHTVQVVDACPADPVLRMAALLHDVGKPSVRAMSDKTNDYTFYGHEVVGGRMADKICQRLRLSNEQRDRVVLLVRQHLVVYDDDWTDAAVRRWITRIGAEAVEPVLAIARADALGKGVDAAEQLAILGRLQARVEALAAQGMALSVRDLALDGNDLMREFGLPPGRRIGDTLKQLLEAVIEEPEANTRERLLELARGFLGN